MMAAWMLYALAIGVGASLTALAAERALRLLDVPGRWVWALALLVSTLAPVALPLRAMLDAPPAPTAPSPLASVATVLVPQMPMAMPSATAPVAVERGIEWGAVIDAVLGWGWLVASLLGVLVLLGSAVSLERARGRWRHGKVAGVPVLLSRDAGPAVVGCFRPAIVIPEWVLALRPEQQRLIVAHEREHRWASDPLLIAAGLVVVVLTPWNLALWWQLSRLRLAIEVDCDRRVLASVGDLKRYGELLLEIGMRSRRNWLPAAAFSEPASFLERRIHAMTFHAPRDRALRAAALLTLVLAAPAALQAAPVVTHPAIARLAQVVTEAREAPFAAQARAHPAAGQAPLRPVGGVARARPFGVASPAPAVARPAAMRPFAGTAAPPRPFRVVALAATPLALQGRADSVPDGIGGYAYKGVLDRVPSLTNRGTIASIMDRLYPPALRAAGIGGTVLMEFVVEADGTPNMRTAKLVENAHPDLVEPTRQALERLRFQAGQVAGRNVRVIIQMPINWNPAAQTAAVGAVRGVRQGGPVAATPVPATGYAAVLGAIADARAHVTSVVATPTTAVARGLPSTAAGRLSQATAQVRATSQGTAEATRALRAQLSAQSTQAEYQRILERAKILIAQRYPSLLAETNPQSASLFVVVAPDGAIRYSRLLRAGETFTWPEGTPTDFRRVTTIRDAVSLGFAPALIETGIMWFEL